MWVNWIKGYFDEKLYDKNDVKEFVKAGWITVADYKKITNEDYAA